DFWPLYREEIKKESPGPGINFESLLALYFKKIQCPLTIETVTDFLKQHRALLLVDGLDEVPDAEREGLLDLLHRFRFRHGGNNKSGDPGNRFLITGRPHGIEGKGLLCFGKYHRRIEELEKKKVEVFISQWYRAVSGEASGFADVTAREMISEIRLHEHAAIFTRNPLLLTALCVFYLVGGKRIPDQRADLYDR
ncbi:MAG: hypothetical protein GY940_16460, partial [bacterium]|nr:hypothetical protein [bacterium]